MRQFMMKNADGQTFDLMRKDAFLSEPAGLGFGQDVELTQAGTGWVLTKISYTRPEPSGQMVFAGYDQYEEFLQFLGAGGTELWYKPLSVWLCLPCAVTLGSETLLDLTGDTVTKGTLLAGRSAHNAAGEQIEGEYTPPDVFTGASAEAAGTSGLVPPPAAGDEKKFLQGDGSWATPEAQTTIKICRW